MANKHSNKNILPGKGLYLAPKTR